MSHQRPLHDIEHVPDPVYSRNSDDVMKTWKEGKEELLREQHSLAFQALILSCEHATQQYLGEQLIYKLQEILQRAAHQQEDTSLAGFSDIAHEYTAQIVWFNHLLTQTISARDLYHQAINSSPEERTTIVRKIALLSHKFAARIRAVRSAGLESCAHRYEKQVEWFRDVMQAALEGKPIPEPGV